MVLFCYDFESIAVDNRSALYSKLRRCVDLMNSHLLDMLQEKGSHMNPFIWDLRIDLQVEETCQCPIIRVLLCASKLVICILC
jgi:hypothetical protein